MRTGRGPRRLLRLDLRALAGNVLPAGSRAREWLGAYAEQFDTVELNASFYRLRRAGAAERWVSQTPDGFLVRGQGEPLPDSRRPACARRRRAPRRCCWGGSSPAPARPAQAGCSGSFRPRSATRRLAERARRAPLRPEAPRSSSATEGSHAEVHLHAAARAQHSLSSSPTGGASLVARKPNHGLRLRSGSTAGRGNYSRTELEGWAGTDPRLVGEPRGLRVLQQRLGGVRTSAAALLELLSC